ncbi:hypothetical protein, unknown function [Leishmania mexicana MHOM/GT/2001/U1103]|uniref:NadR/Ttd14 AAA domain-containing protein n=1 Tax=Leishmania mexicana (strain MHOM/GT/2001/U1103) TaxID=929439 RepID=E9B0Q1_LEIMU|nr:hypothetical protein, unknown function [Leishmania mexicana MHOM/GT/2001/U1103]CBZ28806.1 hypothetical protein, unknown function [Leishmania mexicana MHOM/GT/2001/U1103]
MGVALSTVRHAGTAVLVPTVSAASAEVLPLSSEERVAALPVTTTPPAAANAAATAPAPPAVEHTANPRQRLTDTQVAHAPASLSHAAPKPHRRFPPNREGTSALATLPLAAVLTAAPVTAEAAVKSHRKENRATKPLHPAPASLLTRAKAGRRDATGDAIIAGDHLHFRSCQDAGVVANRNMDCGEDATLAVRSPDEGRRSGTSLQSEGGLYGEKGQRQFAASAKSSPSPASPEAEEVAASACASVKATALADAPGGPAAPLLSSTFTAYRPVARSASPGPALGQYEGLPLTSVQQVLGSKHKVYRICLTGGPCAGKSTMLSAIQAKIPQRTGFRVMCVPEAATLLVTGGMQWDGDLTVPQQLGLLRTQLALEDQFYALAVASNVPTIIVSDRGTMDGRAFCTDAQFQEILRGVGSTIDVLRDRYDAVIHMVTAADGAEEFYNLDNPARYEDLDGARTSDLRLQRMYVGHPMFRLLDNSTSFEDKIERGLQVVSQVVHMEQCAPALPTYYLVRRCPAELPVASATYTTYTTVLGNSQISDIRLLVKREMADGSTMHFFKSVRDAPSAALSSRAPPRATSHASSGASFRSSVNAPTISTASPAPQRIESAQRISSREYASLCKHHDNTRAEVVMRATHFIFEGANYELTTMIAPTWAAGRQTLTVESCTVPTAKQEQEHQHGSRHAAPPATALRLPPFLEVDREVPVESLTTTFLISHKETGPLYTSLAFAPVFSRAVVTALGAHADTENILCSTVSTPRGTPALRTEKGTLHTHPALAEKREDSRLPAQVPVSGEDTRRVENAENSVFLAAPPPLPLPARRGLAPLDVNTLSISAPAKKSASPKAEGTHHVELESLPPHLDESTSIREQHNVGTPSRFSLAGEEGDAAKTTTAAPAGERLQPERLMARDPESILPPIVANRSTPMTSLRS